VDSFHVSRRRGWSPNAFQIHGTADCVSPTSRAIDRVERCVASLGVPSKVLTITSSTSSSVTVRGRPGRGSSINPHSAWERRATFGVRAVLARGVA
jgi:hypothetical protein